jgi:integrase
MGDPEAFLRTVRRSRQRGPAPEPEQTKPLRPLVTQGARSAPPRPAREDRDLEARLFAGSGADAIRTSIAKACKAAGVPLWSPHDLRHRRISLLHLRGVPWVRIAEFVGQRDLSVTADTYTHVLADEKELDYEALLAA